MTQEKRPTIFEGLRERNVTYLIDTSGSMFSKLDVVKEHLAEALRKHAEVPDAHFNLIEFNCDVVQWADKMVKCVPETVKVALDWLRKLEAKTGTNTEAALMAAYSDPDCEAICMVTDGLPDSSPIDILDRVAYAFDGRPVHCIYLTGSTADKTATEFLQDLATDTCGSFAIVTITNHGCVDRVMPVYKASHGIGNNVIRTVKRKIYQGNQKQCSVATTLDCPSECALLPVSNPYVAAGLPLAGVAAPVAPFAPLLAAPAPGVEYPLPRYALPGPRVYTEEDGRVLRVPYYSYGWPHFYGDPRSAGYRHPHLWARYRTARSWLKLSEDLDATLDDMSLSPAAGAMVIGQTVLSRRHEDGYYYSGTVKSQIANDRFLVEFGPCRHGNFKEVTYQETYAYDIIHHADAMRHSIVKGDRVLAPWEPEGQRYGVGVVIDGQESRSEVSSGREYKQLVVTFSNSKSAAVPANVALWIPQDLYERVAFELKLPAKVRRSMADNPADYPEGTLPGYPSSGPKRDPSEWELPMRLHLQSKDAVFDNGMYIHETDVKRNARLKDQSQKYALRQDEIEKCIPGTRMTKEELSEKVQKQIARHESKTGSDIGTREGSRGQHSRRVFHKRHQQRSNKLDSLGHASDGAHWSASDGKEGSDLEEREHVDEIERIERRLEEKLAEQEERVRRRRRDLDDEIERKELERELLARSRYLAAAAADDAGGGGGRPRTGGRSILRKKSVEFEDAPVVYDVEDAQRRHRRRSLSRGSSNSRGGSSSRSCSPVSSSDDSGRSGSADRLKDASTMTPATKEYRRLMRQRRKENRPPWRYWRAESSPSMLEATYGEPFRESLPPEQLELMSPAQWSSSHFQSVVPNGRTNPDAYFAPRPPAAGPPRYTANGDVHLASGSNLVLQAADKRAPPPARGWSPGVRSTQDEAAFYQWLGTVDHVRGVMHDGHQSRIVAHMERSRERQRAATKQVSNTKASKRLVNAELGMSEHRR